MRYLKPPKRFPMPEDMGGEETATWISWIHLETQALLEDLNEEIRLQNEADEPFTRNIVYAPTNSVLKKAEFPINYESRNKMKITGKIPPHRPEQPLEEKFASPLPVENLSNPLPQRTGHRRSEILSIIKENKEIRSKPPAYTRSTATRQINYDNLNWDGNNTS